MPTARPRRHGTLKDIAAHTGLSVSTVSRALANNPVIPEKTRVIVHKAAKELQYRPNALAKALRTRRTNIIGMLVPDIRNPFFASLAAEVQKVAQEKGYSILLQHLGDGETQLERTLDLLVSLQVDGIIAVPHLQDGEIISRIVDQGVPVVAVDRTTAADIPAVTADPTRGITDAITHLKSLNDARLGFIAGPDNASTALLRLEATQKAAKALGCDVAVEVGNYRVDDGKRATQALLAKGVNAILCSNAACTLGALTAVREAKLEVGKDVAIVGFDHADIYEVYDPPIATVDQHIEQISAAAFEQIHLLIQSGKATSVQIDTTFVPRDSARLR